MARMSPLNKYSLSVRSTIILRHMRLPLITEEEECRGCYCHFDSHIRRVSTVAVYLQCDNINVKAAIHVERNCLQSPEKSGARPPS